MRPAEPPPRLDPREALLVAPIHVATPRLLNLRGGGDGELSRETRRFYAFKKGDPSPAADYARAIAAGLHGTGARFDAIAPVPLSPDRAGGLHRTRLLAHRLAPLLGIPVLEPLALERPVTKHNDLPRDPTPADLRNWERAYRQALSLAPMDPAPQRMLIVDDAVARGATLSQCALRLRDGCPGATIAFAAAVRFRVPPKADTAPLRPRRRLPGIPPARSA